MTFTDETATSRRAPHASHRRADIQGLRALAVTLVVIYHMGLPLPGGFTGVDMFFVISGYVIMESLIREYRQSGRIRFRPFFLRRFKRLFPVLILVVTLTLVAASFFLPPFANEDRALQTGIGAIFISANLVIELTTGDYFAPDARFNPLLHTWSLSVEEQFYLLFPLIVIAGLWWGKRRGAPLTGLFLLIAAVTVLSFVAAVMSERVNLPVGNSLLSFYSPVPRAWEFGVGALLALAGQKMPAPGAFASRVSAWGGVVLVGAGATLITPQTPFPGEWALLPVAGTALLVYAGRSETPPLVIRALAVRPAVGLGDLSYSLYLWHWPLIVFVTVGWSPSVFHLTIAVVVSLVLSWLSYRFVEQPLRVRATPTKKSVLGYVVAVFALPGVVILATWFLTSRYLLPLVADVAGSPLEVSTARDERCLSSTRFDDQWAERCTWFADAPGRPVYLVGDSTATHHSEGIIAAGAATGRPVRVWNGIQCIPFSGVLVTKVNGELDREHCADYLEFLEDTLPSAEPGTVVIAFSDIMQWMDSVTYTLPDGSVVSGGAEKGKAVEQPLIDYVNLLASWGHDAILVYPIPNFRSVGPGYSPRMCTLWQILDDTCGPKVERTDMLLLQKQARESIANAARVTGSPTLDLFERYCDDTVCSPSRDRLLTYLDDTHISTAESRSLAPQWERLLRTRSVVGG
jgi:peptidoglycan/LPS O-acetylase OafA/YrhL